MKEKISRKRFSVKDSSDLCACLSPVVDRWIFSVMLNDKKYLLVYKNHYPCNGIHAHRSCVAVCLYSMHFSINILCVITNKKMKTKRIGRLFFSKFIRYILIAPYDLCSCMRWFACVQKICNGWATCKVWIISELRSLYYLNMYRQLLGKTF